MTQQLILDQAFSQALNFTSYPSPIQLDTKNNQQLRKKRNLEIIERNFLIRRFYYPIRQNTEYEVESKAYSILNHFDFESPPYNKFSSIKNISANAFWFLICSNYFPYYSNELIDQKECIPEQLKKLIDYININSVSSNKKNHWEKYIFLKELKKIVQNFSKTKNDINDKKIFQTTNITQNSNTISLNENKFNINLTNLSCTNNISSIKSLLENLIKYFELQNESKILSKIRKDYLLTNNYNRDIRVPEDFELDIKYHTKSFERFRKEILDKEEQQQHNEEEENDDIVCYVCGDGEYEDDNLIIYCSRCNMTVHQKCYGVLIIPEEDWICHLCRAFNDINVCNNMECILCPNLGGAMKPSTLKKSSHSYKIMIKSRKFPLLKDNNNKSSNINNNNLNNSISFFDENKDEKKMENNSTVKNNNNSNINNDSNYNIPENNLFFPDINQTPENLISFNNINNNSNIDANNNTNNNNIDFISNNNNNIFIINYPNNNSSFDNNLYQQNNNSINSCRSSNLNKETESLYSNSSSIKINTKDEYNINNNSFNNKNNNLKKQLKIKSQNEIYLSDRVAKENAWVHLSCALWLPELNISNFDLKEKIKGVENIPKKRLQEICNICLKCGFGPTIKCEKCDYHFHPECARRLKKFFLEINENENGETTFLAYCNKDAPPKHLKKYELIKQRKRDEIKKFSSLIQKDISSLNKIPEDKQYNIYYPYCNNVNNTEMKKLINEEKKIFKKINKMNNFNDNSNYLYNNDILNNDSEKNSINNNSFNFYDQNIELTNSEKNCLINAIREMLIDQSNLTLEINSEDYSIKQNNKIKFTFEDMTYPEKFSWCYLKESQDYLNGISNYETFKIYRSIITNKDDFVINILRKKVISPEKLKRNKNKVRQNHKKIKQEEKFCICNNINKNKTEWVGCENENGKCPGNKWYHLTCISELKNYTIATFSNHFEHYYCPKCRELFKFENVIKKENTDKNINVSLNPEKINNNKNNTINNNMIKLKSKNEENNIIEYANIRNNKKKLNNNKENKVESPMEIDDNIKESKK